MSTPALVDRVRRRLIDAGTSEPSAARVARALREEGVVLGEDAVLDLVGSLRDELAGAGPLEPLLREPSVTDVLVNAPGEVWIDCGEGLQLSGVTFPDDASVRRLAQRLAAAAGRRLDESAPFVDAQLPDGTRLHAVIPPIARECAVVSLRIPRRRSFTLDQLVEVGSLTTVGAAWLRAIVDARLAFLISGGTGTGKTTILSTLLGCVDARERLIIVEDSAELRPDHPHRVCLQSRPANVEGAGAVTLTDLVRQALRMRPDRVIVGEVRGAEVVDLLAALNTGHEGGCGTVHANSLVRQYMQRGPKADLRGLVKPAVILPETKPLDDLLADLQRERSTLAVIVDEYGRPTGVVTVEDVVEEVVGEIDDETDPAAGSIRQLATGEWYVRGHVALSDLPDYGIDLPDDNEAYNSVGGLVFSELGRLPRRGDSINVDGYSLRVESVRENRVTAVRIRPLTVASETDESE